MNRRSLDEALELMNIVSEQFGGFRIDLANGDSMKISDVMQQSAELFGEYDDDLDFYRRRAENAELANARLMAERAKDLADVTALVLDIATGKKPGKAPNLDLVDVVRCKDCKHRGDYGECPMAHINCGDPPYDGNEDYAHDTGFCDYGERKAAE